ncbi:class I SAM-dependent methyltransferase [Pseudomonas oryzihabitans]|nr:class I SAM-dependent methyltransferase [Pseudomonas oryzihabitans]
MASANPRTLPPRPCTPPLDRGFRRARSMNCRHCQAPLTQRFLDLGFAPPSNAYRDLADLTRPEVHYPLRLQVCTHCWLVQTEDYAQAEALFADDYAYFSSTSSSWCAHAARYAETMIGRLALGAEALVMEVAANDGYLLRNFVAAGIPCLGIEPTASTARVAERQGIPILQEFFGRALGERLRREGRQADLLIGNNVVAHVPDINDFAQGLALALKPHGLLTLEFPHLLQLLEQGQFDTVYHEHFSYLSLHTLQRILDAAGLRIHDVEELSTHGGSLRIHAGHAAAAPEPSLRVAQLLARERAGGLQRLETYLHFQARAEAVKNAFLTFLLEQKRAGRTIAAYGAAAKGNTLLNYAGVKPDLLPFICDAAPSKQGRLLPGSHIPIRPPGELETAKPNWVLILPWNLTAEIVSQLAGIRAWQGRFVTVIPTLELH